MLKGELLQEDLARLLGIREGSLRQYVTAIVPQRREDQEMSKAED